MSQFLILIYGDEDARTAESNALRQGHMKFGENNAAVIAGGNALQYTNTATSIRPDGADGFTVTDGPFLEAKEALAGYYLIDVADLDEAIAVAKQIPMPGGGVEVRPIMVLPSNGT